MNNNAYSNLASQGQESSHSHVSGRSTGSRKNAANFYGMEPEELSKSSYARMKDSLITNKLPQKVKTSAFRIDTGLKQSPEFNKNNSAFYQESEPGSRRSKQMSSREESQRGSKLSHAGSQLMHTAEDTESRRIRKAERGFYWLPSSQASSKIGSRPLSQQNNIPNQQDQLREITRGYDNLKDKNLSKKAPAPARIESTASFKAARKEFFLLDSERASSKQNIDARSSSSIHDELPINNKMLSKAHPQPKNSLFSIKEETTGFGKKAELFRNTMMTPQDRMSGAYSYDILTCSYRPK